MQKRFSQLNITTTGDGVIIEAEHAQQDDMWAAIQVSYDSIDMLIAALQEAKHEHEQSEGKA